MTPVCFLAGLLQQAPFHLDSLLAMYDLYRWGGQLNGLTSQQSMLLVNMA